MGKRKKRRAILMREWPADETNALPYDDLIFPLKKIMHEGYKLERLPINQFVYTGYNIGKNEREVYFPTPEERFSSRWLENEKKWKRTLLDNILITAFQLGIEQGRRFERNQRYSSELLMDILNARTKTIKNLREKLGKYDETYKEDLSIPMEHEGEDLLIDKFECNLDNVDI